MIVQELEFRGINLNHLKMYIEELGGKRVTEAFPFVYDADLWSAHILCEEELTFTPVFKVNVVFIQFLTEDAEVMNKIVRKFRLKTTRIGG